MVYLYAVLLTVLNLGFWGGILFNLPGTWLMVLVTAVLTWWEPEYVRVSWTVLGVAAGLAALGEVLEFALGAAGSGRAGGVHTSGGVGGPRQPRRWAPGHGAPGAHCGDADRRLSWRLSGLTLWGSVGTTPAVPERRGGVGGGRGPVLGDGIQAGHRRHHCRYLDAGRVRLMCRS